MQEHNKELLCSLHLESPVVITLSLSLCLSPFLLSLFFLPPSPLFFPFLSAFVYMINAPEPLKSKFGMTPLSFFYILVCISK